MTKPSIGVPVRLRAKALRLPWKLLSTTILALAGLQLAHAGTESAPVTPAVDPKAVVTVPQAPKGWQPGDPISLDNGLVVLDAQVRERVIDEDNWISFNKNIPTRDGAAILQRIRLGLTLNVSKDISIYTQAQDSRTFLDDTGSFATGKPSSTGREISNTDDPFTLRQAYLKIKDIGGENVTFTGGRQVLSYGDQRLVSGIDWDNNARTFDAAKVQYKAKDYSIDLFTAYPVQTEGEGFDTPAVNDLFSGIYASSASVVPGFKTDVYVFQRDKNKVDNFSIYENTDNQSDGDYSPDGDYTTFGTLLKSKPKAFGGWDFTYEGAVQAGRIVDPIGAASVGTGAQVADTKGYAGSQTLLAAMSHVEAGYTFDKASWTPRAFTSFDYATGTSDNTSDGTSNTFQDLFGSNHQYGLMDRFALENIELATIGVSVKPIDKLTVKASWEKAWLASSSDVWRYANNLPVGNSTTRYDNALGKNLSNDLGSEFDLVGTYDLTKWCHLQLGGSHYLEGAYIRESAAANPSAGAANDANFGYTQVQFDF